MRTLFRLDNFLFVCFCILNQMLALCTVAFLQGPTTPNNASRITSIPARTLNFPTCAVHNLQLKFLQFDNWSVEGSPQCSSRTQAAFALLFVISILLLLLQHSSNMTRAKQKLCLGSPLFQCSKRATSSDFVCDECASRRIDAKRVRFSNYFIFAGEEGSYVCQNPRISAHKFRFGA